MGMLSDFYIAARTDSPEYDCGPDFPAEERCQLRGMTPLESAGILAALRGVEDSVALMDEFELLTPQEAEEWIYLVPQDMVDELAKLEGEKLNKVAQQSSVNNAEELPWAPEDYIELFTKLSALAKRAKVSEKVMYLWVSL